ncbi:MAG: SGNH/GDSL hydrolase family protein [Candidatus Coproplasma sp.]
MSVKDYNLEKTYIRGKDYDVKGKSIVRLSSSDIPYWEEEDYYSTDYNVYAIGARKDICAAMGGQRYLKYGEGATFTSRQIAVTYIKNDDWLGDIPQGKTEKFLNTIRTLKRGGELKFLFYGDSITTGCNASGTEMGGNISPYMPPFDKMICEYLNRKFACQINRINTAVGGMDTKWGVNNLDERVIAYAPDLVLIAFGMNDATTPVEEYRKMINEMIVRIHSSLPDTEIMLVAPMLPNNESDENWYGNQQFFNAELVKLENEYDFVAEADVTTMHKYILSTGKRYRDMTANNINHPNDFLVRLYAQVILTTLLGEDFD